MKKLFRIMSLVLALVLAFVCLAACSSGSEPTEAPATEAPAATEEPAASQPYTFPLAETEDISVYKSFTNIAAPYISGNEEVLTYQEIENRLNINFEFQDVSDAQASELFNVMIASNDYCDVLDTSLFDYFNGGLDVAIEQDIILPLDDYLDTCMPNYSALLEGNDDYHLIAITENGHYASTYNFSREDAPVTVSLCIREDYLEGVGMDMPVTYDDYYEVLQAFNSEYGATLWMNQYGSLYGNCFSGGFGVATYEVGVDTMFILKDGTEVTYSPLESGWLDYVTYMNKLYSEGLIYPDYLGTVVAMSPQIEVILSDEVGVFICGVTSFETYTQQSETEGFRMVAANPPVVNEGDAFHFSKVTNTSAGWCMSTQCENPELVACVLDYFYTDEGIILANYGMEGETFNYDEDGNPVLTDLVLNNPEGMTYFIANQVYIGSAPTVADWTKQTSRYTEDQNEAGDIWGTDDSWYIPTFVTMNDEEQDMYDAFTDISTYTAECMLQFITGEKPLSEYDAFVEQLYAMGVQDCIDAWASAYDRYLAKADLM